MSPSTDAVSGTAASPRRRDCADLAMVTVRDWDIDRDRVGIGMGIGMGIGIRG